MVSKFVFLSLWRSPDTLHRFCKKEHDWGWKKFMELSKVLDGFTVADTLVIKAQVQVIRYFYYDFVAKEKYCIFLSEDILRAWSKKSYVY